MHQQDPLPSLLLKMPIKPLPLPRIHHLTPNGLFPGHYILLRFLLTPKEVFRYPATQNATSYPLKLNICRKKFL